MLLRAEVRQHRVVARPHRHAPLEARGRARGNLLDDRDERAGAAALTDKYKAQGSKPDMAALDKMFEDAFSSVTGAAS
jgi:hypothetical protein